jgi:hypothetical protein
MIVHVAQVKAIKKVDLHSNWTAILNGAVLLEDMKLRRNLKDDKYKGWGTTQLNILPHLRDWRRMLWILMNWNLEFCKYVDIIGSLNHHWLLKTY